MYRIPVSSLRPGMVVGNTLNDSNGNVLIANNVVLTEAYIKGLKRANIPALYIREDSIPEVEVRDIINESTRTEAISCVKNTLATVTKSNSFGFEEEQKLRSIVEDILDQIVGDSSIIVNMSDIRSVDDYLFGHSVNVCVLSLLTGITLGLSKEELNVLGMGAMLHDIGKILVPPEVLNKPGNLNDEEMEIIKKHSQQGFEILEKRKERIHALIKLIVQQHHERINGEGYPHHLKGDEVHPFSQIVGIADMFDAMTADRVYRKAHPTNEAYELLLGAGGFYFKFEIVQAFLKNVAAYPNGTVVQLNTGDYAVVSHNDREFPLHPIVKLIADSDGKIISDHSEIDISKNHDIAIARSLNYIEYEILKLAMQNTEKAS